MSLSSVDTAADYAMLALHRARRRLIFSALATVFGLAAIGVLAAAGVIALSEYMDPVWACLAVGGPLALVALLCALFGGRTQADRLAEAAMARSVYGMPGAAMPGGTTAAVGPVPGAAAAATGMPGAAAMAPDPLAALASTFVTAMRMGRRL